MTPEEKARLEACTREIAEILYREAESKDAEQLKTLEGIEIAVREQMLENVSPNGGIFCRKKQWDKGRKGKKSEKLHRRTQTEEQASQEIASKSKSKIMSATRKMLLIGT